MEELRQPTTYLAEQIAVMLETITRLGTAEIERIMHAAEARVRAQRP